MAAQLPKNVGWVGLGLMGDPMARNLLKKMHPDTKFFVYDVIPEAIEKFVQEGQGRVVACRNSREVAEKSVLSQPSFNCIPSPQLFTECANRLHRTSSSPWSPKAATSAPST